MNRSDAATIRLRPSVYASPVADGVHVRGWTSALTMAGGPDLWRLWSRLEPALRNGISPAAIDALPASPATRQAVRRLLAALREHDLLLDGTAGGDAGSWVADWYAQLSADPDPARRRVHDADVTVVGTGPVADAAVAALSAAGVEVPPPRGTGPVVIDADGAIAVAAVAGDRRGYVTPAGTRAAVVDLAGRLAERQRTGARPSDPLAALLGCAAAHRFISRVAGLSTVDGATWPLVYVARTDPLSAGYRPWLLSGPSATPRPAEDLDDVLRRLDAVCDEELGLLPAPRYDDLPQLPSAVATCRRSVGTGATTGAARLDAAVRAAERLLDPAGGGRVAVGADALHADGVLLRRAVHARARALSPVDSLWTDAPLVARWWRALTVRFGVAARGSVVRLGDGVHLARVEAAGRELGWAVEATPEDAAAFAAMRATAAEQARRSGLADDGAPMTMCGAVPAARPPYDWDTTWMVGPWRWPATRSAEVGLQRALRLLAPPARWPVPAASGRTTRSDLLDGLGTAGFAVCRTVDHG
jgi:hypothetical protein